MNRDDKDVCPECLLLFKFQVVWPTVIEASQYTSFFDQEAVLVIDIHYVVMLLLLQTKNQMTPLTSRLF
jgi:hypothetical protein